MGAVDVDQLAAQAFGGVDILVNCAGTMELAFVGEMSDGVWERTLTTNLTGTFYMTREASNVMRGARYGRIINLSSMKSLMGTSQMGYAAYCASKGGVNMFTKQCAAELGRYGITVNAIAPGWIDTPMFHKATDNDPPRLAKIMGRIPAKSVGDPMDVGMCAAFLCSDAARYISGTCIPVDGGALIGF